MQKAFSVDLNQCTGCGACMIACTIEQQEDFGLNRRNVVTFNESRHPMFPVFSFSMACNHCHEPACAKNCPAAAINKDGVTGAVLLDRTLCLGCKYCTWACPYDAPRFDAVTGTVAKCDLCIARLRQNESPACVCACPTEALTLDECDPTQSPEPRLEGLTRAGLFPALRFKNLGPLQQRPVLADLITPQPDQGLFIQSLNLPPKKITLAKEYTLLLFTSIAFILTGWFAAALTRGLSLPLPLFWGLGGLAMALSTLHLGKKLRAYRAVFNITRSWLSREIFLYSAFLALGGLYLLISPPQPVLGWLALGTGCAGLFAIDRIYQVALHIGPTQIHSAHTLLNALYLAGFLTGNTLLFAGLATLKLSLYLYRKHLQKKQLPPPRFFPGLARIVLGLAVPALFFFLKPALSTGFTGWVVVFFLVLGDVLDRIEYYRELDIITPKKQMILDLLHHLKHNNKNT